jgi:iron complex outermembrane receptor protein
LFDATGKQLAMAPPWTGNIGGTYTYPLSFGGSLVGHIDARYVDSRYGILDAGQNAPQYFLPSYSTANARLGYQSEGDVWEVFLWAKNFTNTVTALNRSYLPLLGPTTAYPQGFAEELATYNEPRTFGLTLRYKFH